MTTSQSKPQADKENQPAAVATPTLDYVHKFLAKGMHESMCRVRVFQLGPELPTHNFPQPESLLDPHLVQMVVVLTELSDNHGPSVTNSIDQIASELLPGLVKMEELRELVKWIEHSPRRENIPESFDLVNFGAFDDVGPYYSRKAWSKGFSAPTWRPITRGELELLVGGRFA